MKNAEAPWERENYREKGRKRVRKKKERDL
jgi:hypothetical protein